MFHTQLAERQLHIDRLERAVDEQRELFDELRYERAELRSPVRLAEAAGAMGMERGDTGDFVRVTPEAVARQIAAAGSIDGGNDAGRDRHRPAPAVPRRQGRDGGTTLMANRTRTHGTPAARASARQRAARPAPRHLPATRTSGPSASDVHQDFCIHPDARIAR